MAALGNERQEEWISACLVLLDFPHTAHSIPARDGLRRLCPFPLGVRCSQSASLLSSYVSRLSWSDEACVSRYCRGVVVHASIARQRNPVSDDSNQSLGNSLCFSLLLRSVQPDHGTVTSLRAACMTANSLQPPGQEDKHHPSEHSRVRAGSFTPSVQDATPSEDRLQKLNAVLQVKPNLAPSWTDSLCKWHEE